MFDSNDVPPPTGPWVRSGVLENAPQLIQELGGDAARICAAAGFSVATIEAEDIPLRFSQVVRFLNLASRLCATEDFGLLLAERQTLAVLGPLWLLMQNAPTVKQMLLDMKQYGSLHSSALGGDLVPRNGGLELSYHLIDPDLGDDRQTIELGLALLCNELRQHAPPGWQPISVQLRYAPPAAIKRYQRIFGPHLAFNQDVNALTVDPVILASPLRAARPTHHQVLSDLLRQRQNLLPNDIVRSASTVMHTLIPLGNCTLAHVSRRLAMSERTLQRHLQAAGTCFAILHDRIRADLAQKYLLKSTLKAAEIAEILGYSDLTALSRSFRRWNGMSIREARKKQKETRATQP
ncbi:TPA: AraC family transcriptional regulator [Pseudomonas aeruginosa]|uniref:AraC family transcriptional regulator n=1 Tax=Pseudomonas aeruginosa TaxID=287 RepID=UPI003981C21A|nr:AraC family transcriptional regulator [Pseudomonas aeruginosa]HBP1309458.1 AraC family transcriptional regulator [Pseudomonas aeruginosa]HCF6352980.1 AraC family transcriptional regulator [Pseudomonas aeruginosa]